MQLVNRKTLARIGALILVLTLILSSTACLAASFKKSAAGVKYGGKTFKLGATTSKDALKAAFGSVRTSRVPVCGNMPYGGKLYKFSSKGINIETRYKNAKKTSEQIVTITLTGSSIPTLAGLKIGDTTSKLSQKYGRRCYVDPSNKKHVYYNSGDYYMDVFTKSATNSKGKKVNVITKLVFLID